MASIFKTEPSVVRTAIVTVVAQILSVGITLGILHLDPTQVATINTAVALVSAAIAALWVRSGVTPVDAPNLGEITSDLTQTEAAPVPTEPAPAEEADDTVVPDAAAQAQD